MCRNYPAGLLEVPVYFDVQDYPAGLIEVPVYFDVQELSCWFIRSASLF